MDITIRPYAPEDWPALQEIHDPARRQELHLSGLDGAFLPLSIAAEREDLFGYSVFVACLEGAAVGFVAFTPEELAWLYVRREQQRRGIGRALAEFALAHMNAGEKTVEVLFGNDPARRLYRSLGFTRETVLTGVMPGNEAYPVRVYSMTREG